MTMIDIECCKLMGDSVYRDNNVKEKVEEIEV